jgi:hypothetical protein
MSRNANILLAEDEETDAYFVNMAFKKAGLSHSISHVLDGQQAKQLFFCKLIFRHNWLAG